MTLALHRSSRADAAYQHLRAYIERADVPEGSRLPSESDFVDLLQLSRASIREALARLRAEGRAVSRRGSGTFSTAGAPATMLQLSAIDSIEDLVQWHEVRVALESEAAALSAERRSDQQLAAMRTAQDVLMRKLFDDHAETEDAEFHRAVAAGAGNPKLLDAVGPLAAHIFRWTRLSRDRPVLSLSERREVIAVEHAEIVQAIAEKRPDAARLAARRHLLNGRARLLSALKR